MGKQKDLRHVNHLSHKKKDKKIDKASKPSRSSCHDGYLKSVEGVVQAELESIANTKKICRKVRKEVERFPLLAKAVYLGCERVVDNILEAGENVNVQVQGGKTPLIIAVENGYPGIVQKLLKRGADPKLLRQDGRNALMIAVSNNDNRSFTMIWNYWDKSNFCELNHSDSRGFTVLTIAAEHGYSQFTNFLLSLNGIEVDKQTKDGRTPLMLAVATGQVKTVQKFLASGSDIALEDKDGATAVCFAITQNDAEIKSVLLESLDSKSRDVYAKKRIELLARPRTEDNLEATSFYKDILFRVILEIRRSFEDGVALLEKYKVFVGLLKCLKKHQQDTELLKSGFHLAVCIMYDKAEYSRYIVEELAEQYVSAKGADFALKVMSVYRLKSLGELRGAAFLTIHAGTQCRSGKMWLKTNYFQILPFVKEFKLVFPTLTFWAEGESVKAKIMFDRFEEHLRFLEKDIKDAQLTLPGDNEATVATAIPATQMVKRNRSVSNASMNSTVSDQQWSVVSKSKSGFSKSSSKNPRNQTLKKETNRKNKGSKLQTKLQRKIAVKKLITRPNIKYIPGHSSGFPALPTEINFSQTGYADALKKNLQSDDPVQSTEEVGQYPKDSGSSSSKSSYSAVVNSSSWTSNDEPELQDNPVIKDTDNRDNSEAQETKLDELEKGERGKMQDLWDLWSKVTHAKNPLNLMTLFMNMFMANATRNETCDQRVQTEMAESSVCSSPEDTVGKNKYDREFPSWEISEQMCKKETVDPSSNVSSEVTVVRDHCQGQRDKKRMYDIFAALGFKVPSEQNNGNDAAEETSSEYVLADNPRTSSPKNNRQEKLSDLSIHEESLAENSLVEAEKEEDSTIDNGTDLSSTFESETSFDLNYSKTSSEKDTPFSATDSTFVEDLNDDYTRNGKRKYFETCLQDLSFIFYKEEIKETGKALGSLESRSNRQYYQNLSRVINDQNARSSALSESKAKEIRSLKVNKNKCNNLDLKSNFCKSIIIENYTTPEGTLHPTLEKRFHTSLLKSESDVCISYITEKTKDIKALDEKKNKPKFMINGTFSDFNSKSCKRKMNPRNSLLTSNITRVIPKLKSIGIQKYILMYQRLILYKMPLWSGIFSNIEPLQSDGSFLRPLEKKQGKESKNLKSLPGFATSTGKLNEDKPLLIIQKHYDTVVNHKLKYDRYYQTVLLHATSRFPMNSAQRRGIKDTKIMDRDKRKQSKLTKSLDLNSKNKEHSDGYSKSIFNSCFYGYKSQFINCESGSRWYQTLNRIESCVPLVSFLMGFREADSIFHTDSTMHELVCSSGKIIFSTKEEHILRAGEHGTYIGLMNTGNPVVVKEFQKSSHDAVELLSKKRRVNHRNIVAFHCLCSSPTDQTYFAVTELVEYSLPEYLRANIIHFDGKNLVRGLVEGLRYLHKRQIVHGFLKPSNVMVAIDHRLKLSDFYKLDVFPLKYGTKLNVENKAPSAIGSSLSDLSWRPYELITAATATEARKYLTTASDIQVAGMLIYYILSRGKHPFGISDFQCIENIRGGFPELGLKPADIESRDLIRDMIKRVPLSRPAISLVAKHPYLWEMEKRFKFLVAVSRKIEFFTRKPTKIAEALQDSCIEARDWTCCIHFKVLKFIGQSTNKTYADNFLDLLLFLVALNDHFENMSSEIKFLVEHPSVYTLRTFPSIFMSVYSVLRDNPCVQRQMALQAYF